MSGKTGKGSNQGGDLSAVVDALAKAVATLTQNVASLTTQVNTTNANVQQLTHQAGGSNAGPVTFTITPGQAIKDDAINFTTK